MHRQGYSRLSPSLILFLVVLSVGLVFAVGWIVVEELSRQAQANAVAQAAREEAEQKERDRKSAGAANDLVDGMIQKSMRGQPSGAEGGVEIHTYSPDGGKTYKAYTTH